MVACQTPACKHCAAHQRNNENALLSPPPSGGRGTRSAKPSLKHSQSVIAKTKPRPSPLLVRRGNGRPTLSLAKRVPLTERKSQANLNLFQGTPVGYTPSKKRTNEVSPMVAVVATVVG